VITGAAAFPVAAATAAAEAVRSFSPVSLMPGGKVWKKIRKRYFGSVLRIWDVYPGSEFFSCRIPDPGSKRSRIRIKEFSYF
jgi:hypothetical protein